MTLDRRKFIKLSGLIALGAASRPVCRLLAGETRRATPAPGKQLAMAIDLRVCREQKDCTKCVDACHAAHNVPDFGNPKDEIKWIWKEHFEGAFPDQDHDHLRQDVLETPLPVLCNHCRKPPCVRVCPTKATWRRESDGIVMMDWHRCIGCRYCVAACPYGSRSFNWRDPRGVDSSGRPFIAAITPDFPTRAKGVVEKCTFCSSRLAEGLPPACVEACEPGAMAFGDLNDPESAVSRLLSENFSIRRKAGLGTEPQVYYIV